MKKWGKLFIRKEIKLSVGYFGIFFLFMAASFFYSGIERVVTSYLSLVFFVQIPGTITWSTFSKKYDLASLLMGMITGFVTMSLCAYFLGLFGMDYKIAPALSISIPYMLLGYHYFRWTKGKK